MSPVRFVNSWARLLDVSVQRAFSPPSPPVLKRGRIYDQTRDAVKEVRASEIIDACFEKREDTRPDKGRGWR
jgi:hypothetical protein